MNKEPGHPSKQNKVVKLIQNVYGLTDARYTWHKHVKQGLLSHGFKQSCVDLCLFYKRQVLSIMYMGNTVCLSKDEMESNTLIINLKEQGYKLRDEGELSAYLGLQVNKLDDKIISLTEPAFIEQIINQANLKDLRRMHNTPADAIL